MDKCKKCKGTGKNRAGECKVCRGSGAVKLSMGDDGRVVVTPVAKEPPKGKKS